MAHQYLDQTSAILKDDKGYYVPATQRPDGTWRKERRLKENYIPQDEVALYESRGKKFATNKPKLPPGAPVTMVAVSKQQPKQVLTEKQPKQEKSNAPVVIKEKEKNKPEVKKSDEEPGTDPVKRVRNLKKKLKNIDELEVKVAEGYSIDNDQRKKISTKNAVIKEIAQLEAIIKVLYPEPPKPAKKEGKKKDGKKDSNKKETKENKPTKITEKKSTPVLTNGNQAKKSDKKSSPPVQQNSIAAKKTDKVTNSEVKTKAQPKPQSQGQLKTQSQAKTQAQSKTQAKSKSQPKEPVIEISVEAAKRIRNLKKKLKTIDELELKVAQGGKIDNDQRVKLSKKSEVLAEIRTLESGK